MNSLSFKENKFVLSGAFTMLRKHHLPVVRLRETVLVARNKFKVTSLKFQRDTETQNSDRKFSALST